MDAEYTQIVYDNFAYEIGYQAQLGNWERVEKLKKEFLDFCKQNNIEDGTTTS